MGKLYPVEQVDRERAWDFARFHCLPDSQMRERWFSGYYDESGEGAAIQAFARHRIEATPAVDREGVASLFDEALNEHGPAGYGRDTPTQVAFGQVLSKLRHDILALHPVKQSDGLAERVIEACAARVQAMADERFAVEPKFGGFSIAEGNALDRAARTIRSLDITRMDSDG